MPGPTMLAAACDALQLRVALGQVGAVDQRGQVRLVGDLEDHRRQPGRERDAEQLTDGERVERGGQRQAGDEQRAAATSHQISSGRWRDRSTHTPAGSPISSQGSHSSADSTPTSNADACR